MIVQLPQFRMNPDEHIIPLQYEHLFDFELQEHEREYARAIPDYLRYVWDNSMEGWSWSAVGRGKIIAIFGLREYWGGTVEAWFLPGENLKYHTPSVVRGARAILGGAIRDYDITRMQICVKTTNDTAFRFAKALDFEVESTMRKFGPEGADYYMMVRFN